MKPCYAGINKGVAAIGSAVILAAARSGASAALYQEMAESAALQRFFAPS